MDLSCHLCYEANSQWIPQHQYAMSSFAWPLCMNSVEIHTGFDHYVFTGDRQTVDFPLAISSGNKSTAWNDAT